MTLFIQFAFLHKKHLFLWHRLTVEGLNTDCSVETLLEKVGHGGPCSNDLRHIGVAYQLETLERCGGICKFEVMACIYPYTLPDMQPDSVRSAVATPYVSRCTLRVEVVCHFCIRIDSVGCRSRRRNMFFSHRTGFWRQKKHEWRPRYASLILFFAWIKICDSTITLTNLLSFCFQAEMFEDWHVRLCRRWSHVLRWSGLLQPAWTTLRCWLCRLSSQTFPGACLLLAVHLHHHQHILSRLWFVHFKFWFDVLDRTWYNDAVLLHYCTYTCSSSGSLSNLRYNMLQVIPPDSPHKNWPA